MPEDCCTRCCTALWIKIVYTIVIAICCGIPCFLGFDAFTTMLPMTADSLKTNGSYNFELKGVYSGSSFVNAHADTLMCNMLMDIGFYDTYNRCFLSTNVSTFEVLYNATMIPNISQPLKMIFI